MNVLDAEGNRYSNTDCTRRGIPRTQAPKKICFICNEARDVDSSKYSEGGLGRCEHDRSKETILSCQDFYKSNRTHDYYQVSQRLDILLSGTSYDIFSQAVYYHHSCYRRFTRMAKPNKAVMSEEHGLPAPVITNTRTLKRRILEELQEEMSFFS